MKRTSNQYDAARPQHSVWVNANAGTGKTRVLIDRVLRLLLDGAQPEQILCLTYTNAAATEMQTRLQQQLQAWHMADEALLQQSLQEMLGKPATQQQHIRAKSLFRTLMLQHGQVQFATIHSFCQSLLMQFPLEANTQPYFTVLEPQAQKQLQETAWKRTLAALEDELPYCLQVKEAPSVRDDVLHMRQLCIRNQQPIDALPDEAALLQHFDLDVTEAPDAPLARALHKAQCNELFWQQLLLAWQGNPEKYAARSQVLQQLLHLQEDEARAAMHEAYFTLFFRKDRTARKRIGSILLKKERERFVQLEAQIAQEQERLEAALEASKRQDALHYTHSLHHLLQRYEAAYTAEKHAQAALDFDDLLLRAHFLLHHTEHKDWVRYKLDWRLQHILVDESQDTSPLQWHILHALLDTFFTEHEGENATQALQPSLFIVGDEKQSIYSFQGANMEAYQAVREYYDAMQLQYKLDWKNVALATNFRSSQRILDVADSMLQQIERPSIAPHTAFFAELPGYVAQHPLIPRKEGDTVETQRTELAEQIAAHIKQLLEHNTQLESKKRAAEPGDILVLVRKRNQFVELLTKALQHHGIAVSGADRLVVQHALPAQDILCAIQALLTPYDALSLMQLLRGPFCDVPLATASAWAADKSKTLYEHMLESEIADWYNYWQEMALHASCKQFVTAFLQHAPHVECLLQKHGAVARDIITRIEQHAYRWQLAHPGGSLRHWLHEVQLEFTELKRDMETAGNAVRIMSIHGAKGLEAPIVYLPDTTDIPILKHAVHWDSAASMPVSTRSSILLPAMLQPLKTQEKEAMQQEYHRLLYVAITRAEEQLYMFGTEPDRLKEAPHYYAVLEASLQALSADETEDGVLAYGTAPQQLADVVIPAKIPSATAALKSAPAIAHSTSQHAIIKHNENHTVNKNNESDIAAMQGTQLHRIVELYCSNNQLTAAQSIESLGEEMPNKTEWVQKLEALFNDQTLAWIFDKAQGKSEVPIIYEGRLYRIDRLVRHNNIWHIIDYKSHSNTTITDDIKQQLNMYKSALSMLHPEDSIQTYILWLHDNRLENV